MINLSAGTKVYLACQPINLRAGFNGLAAKVQQVLGQDPFGGSLFLFHGKRGDYFKAIYWDGSWLWLLAKRLEKGRDLNRAHAAVRRVRQVGNSQPTIHEDSISAGS